MRAAILLGLGLGLGLSGPAVRAAAEPIAVGVVPMKGGAPADLREDATKILEQSLSGLPDLDIVSFANMRQLLGTDAARALEACVDDACLRDKTARVKTDVLVVSYLELEETLVLRVRLLETGTTAPPLVRVSKTVAGGRSGLVQAISSAVTELFPERAKSALGEIEVMGTLPAARVFVDGVEAASLGVAPVEGYHRTIIRVRPGARRVEVVADGYFPFEASAAVIVGRRTTVRAQLDKNRSNGPLILAGVGGAAAVVGLLAGLSVKSTADEWDAACGTGRCDEGYTRVRYESDADAVARGRLVANGLFIVGAAAVVGAVVWFFLDPGESPDLLLETSGAQVGWSW